MRATRIKGRPEAAFTLIEIMAGTGIFLICVVSILSLFGVAIDAHKGQVDRSAAAIVAQRGLSHFRAFPPSDIRPFPQPAAPTPTPTPEPWVLELAGPIRKGDTDIVLAALPPLAQTLALATDSGVFWQPASGKPSYALIEDPRGAEMNEWIAFDDFRASPPSLRSVSRGLFKTDPRDHPGPPAPQVATIRISFYFPDYPTYPFLLRTRRYSIDTPPLHDPAGDVIFDILDLTVFWNEVGRAQQETFSFALTERTQFDRMGTAVFFAP